MSDGGILLYLVWFLRQGVDGVVVQLQEYFTHQKQSLSYQQPDSEARNRGGLLSMWSKSDMTDEEGGKGGETRKQRNFKRPYLCEFRNYGDVACTRIGQNFEQNSNMLL